MRKRRSKAHLYSLVQRAYPRAQALVARFDNAADRNDRESCRRYVRALRRVRMVQAHARAELDRHQDRGALVAVVILIVAAIVGFGTILWASL